jgi:hypothetical protein
MIYGSDSEIELGKYVTFIFMYLQWVAKELLFFFLLP